MGIHINQTHIRGILGGGGPKCAKDKSCKGFYKANVAVSLR